MTVEQVSDVLAVAFVVDSSLAVYEEWDRIKEYVSVMLKRLTEVHPNRKPRLGFVTYGTASTLLSPVLCKRFFNDFPSVSKEMREAKDDTSKLGIGGTGGGEAMSALEGLVAAIELFDILRACTRVGEAVRPHVCHIFHITAVKADTAEHPQWNDSPLLDSVTWDTLPIELKKRNIHMSTILLRQRIPRYTELHSAAVTGPAVTPWFSVRPPHSILLAGFPNTTATKGTQGNKRQSDPQIPDRAPDPKRPRLSHPTESSPKPPVMKTPTLPAKEPPPAPPPAVTQPPPPIPQPVAPPVPPQSGASGQQAANAVSLQRAAFLERIRVVEDQLRKLEAAITAARAAGNTVLAEGLHAEYVKKSAAHQGFKNAIAAYVQNQQKALAQAQVQGLGQNPSPGKDAAPQGPPTTNMPGPSAQPQMQPTASPSHTFKEAPAPALPFGQPKLNVSAENLSGSSGAGMAMPGQSQPNPPPFGTPPMANRQPIAPPFAQLPNSMPTVLPNQNNNVPPQPSHGMPNAGGHMSPDVAAQMQKMIEQRKRGGPQQLMGGNVNLGAGQLPNPMPMPNSGHPGMGTGMRVGMGGGTGGGMSINPGGGLQPQGQPQAAPSQSGEQPGGGPPKSNSTPVWQGSLSWSGIAAQGKKEVRTLVVASTQNTAEARADTWPSVLQLTPTGQPAVSMPDLQAWMKRHKPVLCTFQAQSRVTDPKGNETAYRSLVQLLTMKSLYAHAGWTTPSGDQTNNVLVFPINGVGLVGAFFPLTGIPDLPKPSAPPGGAGPPGNLPNGMNFPPHVLAQLQRLSADQRTMVLAQLMRSKQQQLQQQQLLAHQQAAAAGGSNTTNAMNAGQDMQQQQPQLPFGMNTHPPNFGPGNNPFGVVGNQGGPGSNHSMNTMGLGQPGGGGMATAGSPRPMGGGVPGGMPGGAFSLEMMQSFMQRNEGGMGPA